MLSNGSKLNDIRQLIADNSISDYSEIYRLLYDDVETYGKGKIAECILNIAEAQYQDVNVVDKEINFMSLIIRLLRVTK
jgi:ABC-type polysaccharide/polyol phosphate transport system ATPase subunit